MSQKITAGDIRTQRDIPQVEKIVSSEGLVAYVEAYSRPYVTMIVRGVLDNVRAELESGKTLSATEFSQRIVSALDAERFRFATRVINATGIVIHTNLGRAPLGKSQAQEIAAALSGYTNLEYDIADGCRGKRGTQVSRLFKLLTGAEAACVVNNNAAAVYLILATFANGKECIVARSELVQIGGGFRMPEVMKAGGAILKEIGTTNKVTFDDYYRTVSPNTGLIAKIHWSNFKISGFTESVTLKQLSGLAQEKNIPLMYDLGSGSVLDPKEFGLADEPSVRDAISADVDLTCFSGDKLFGGTQAGIIVGKKKFMEKVNAHPLYRACRPNKITLFLLERTLLSYLRGNAERDLPTPQLLSGQPTLLKMRAENISERLASAGIKSEIVKTRALTGGGSAPEIELPSYGIAIINDLPPDETSRRLRHAPTPVIGRIVDNRVILDLKAVFKDDDEELINNVVNSLKR